MKIRCDVCDKVEASVFCVADEAALCAACDGGVHHANKLSRKHQRFSLHYPSSSRQAPVCDICQDKRAFLFCREDRAILCKDCDISVHKANENTKKHARFLLTGVKLSPTSSLYSDPQSSSESASSSAALARNVPEIHGPPELSFRNLATQTFDRNNAQMIDESVPTSSISEYLMETLPGWRVEDFLDSSSLPGGGNEMQPPPFLDAAGAYDHSSVGYPAESTGFWVPQMCHAYNQAPNQSMDHHMAFWAENSDALKEQAGEFTVNSSRKWSADNCFAVPQIMKRYRTWW